MIEGSAFRITKWVLVYPLLIASSAVMLFPLVWTLSTSLKTSQTVTLREIKLIPDPVQWSNYITIFQEAPLVTYTLNTMYMVMASVAGGVVICALAGYAFARISFPAREVLFYILLSTMMLPHVVQIIPLFVIFDRMHLVGTFWPLIIPRLLGHNAFYIFLMRQFFRGIPAELSDAARMDGCTELGIWARVIMPNSKPVLAAVAIFSIQFAWNDFLSPLIYLGARKELWTLALGLNAQKGFEGEITSLHKMMVISVYMIVPMLLVFALGQKYMIEGVTFSGMKG